MAATNAKTPENIDVKSASCLISSISNIAIRKILAKSQDISAPNK